MPAARVVVMRVVGHDASVRATRTARYQENHRRAARSCVAEQPDRTSTIDFGLDAHNPDAAHRGLLLRFNGPKYGTLSGWSPDSTVYDHLSAVTTRLRRGACTWYVKTMSLNTWATRFNDDAGQYLLQRAEGPGVGESRLLGVR